MNRAYLIALWHWIDLEWPTTNDLKVALIGFDAWGVAAITIGLGAIFLGDVPDPASHEGVKQAAESSGGQPNLGYLGVLLFAAVYEELIFRNGVQKVLHSRCRPAVAIGVASLFFTSLHYWSYTDVATISTVISLGIVLLAALVLGTTYWKTKNVVTPILIHGAINSLAWLSTWV